MKSFNYNGCPWRIGVFTNIGPCGQITVAKPYMHRDADRMIFRLPVENPWKAIKKVCGTKKFVFPTYIRLHAVVTSTAVMFEARMTLISILVSIRNDSFRFLKSREK